jgi:EpsI family protein
LFGIGMTFRDGGIVHRPSPEGDATVPGSFASFLAAAAATVLVAGAAPAYAGYVHQRLAETRITADLVLPAGFTTWTNIDTGSPTWTPAFLGTDRDYHWRFRAPESDATVDLHIAFYRYQRDGAEIVNSMNKVAGPHWQWVADSSTTVRVEGGDRRVPTSRLSSRALSSLGGRVAAYWYWVDGRIVTNPLLAKAMQVKANLLNHQVSAAAIIVSAPFAETPREAVQTITAFLESAQPLGPALAAVTGE